MAHIQKFPAEMLAKILTEHGLQLQDLAQAARVCKAFTGEATRATYLYNIEHQRSSVVIMAAQQGRIDWMRKALVMGADVNAVGPGHGEIFEDLKDHWDTETYPADGKYGTPLHYAALRGDNDMVALLLESGADLNAASFQLCHCTFQAGVGKPPDDYSSRWLPLHHAVCRGHILTANLLLDHGAPLQMDYAVSPDEKCQSLIHVAATHGLVTLVQRAIAMGTSASKTTWDGTTPLHCTSLSWNSEVVIQCLLSAGAKLDAKDYLHKDPLLRACAAGNFSTALFLLKAEAKIHPRTRTDQTGMRRLLVEAALGGSNPIPFEDLSGPLDDRDKEQVELLRTLIQDSGKTYNCHAAYGRSLPGDEHPEPGNDALISAACCRRRVVPGVVRLLLNKGSNPNHHNRAGVVPLQLILDNARPSGEWILYDCANNYRQAIYTLLEHGARVHHLHLEFLQMMRLWVKEKYVERTDRNLFRRLLKQWYEEMAAEDETSADESAEDNAAEDDDAEDDAGG